MDMKVKNRDNSHSCFMVEGEDRLIESGKLELKTIRKNLIKYI